MPTAGQKVSSRGTEHTRPPGSATSGRLFSDWFKPPAEARKRDRRGNAPGPPCFSAIPDALGGVAGRLWKSLDQDAPYFVKFKDFFNHLITQTQAATAAGQTCYLHQCRQTVVPTRQCLRNGASLGPRFRQDFLGDVKRMICRRNAAVDRGLQEHFLYFFSRHAVRQGSAKMQP